MSNAKKLLPVEPLSEKRWEAIERGVLDHLDAPADRASLPADRSSLAPGPLGRVVPMRERRRTPLVVLGIAATFVAAGLAFAMLPSSRPDTTLPVANRLASTRIATDLASVETNLGEVGVELAAGSELTAVGSDAEGWLVVLERGTATFEVPPRRERPALIVQAGSTRIEVVGTRFTATRSDHVSVSVHRGRVRVLEGEGEWDVGEGERWPAETASADAISRETAETAPREVAQIALSPRPVSPERAEGVRSVPSVSSPTPPVSVSQPVVPAPSARDRFEHAASLEASRPDEALTLYAALESEGGAWAANALFARGRLMVDLGRRTEARALLQRYVDRHPGGPNAQDARALLDGTR